MTDPSSSSTGVPVIFEQGGNVVRRAVLIANNFPVTENQCIALVRELGLFSIPYRVTRPRGGRINEWLRWLPVSFHKKLDFILRPIYLFSRLMFTSNQSNFNEYLPTAYGSYLDLGSIPEADVKEIVTMARQIEGLLLVVACGSDTVSIVSSIRRLAPEKVFVVQIQHPRTDLNRFDMVIRPRHDYYPFTREAQEQRETPEDHVVLTTGALHQIDYDTYNSMTLTLYNEFSHFRRPFVVVYIGCPRRNCWYGPGLAKQLTNGLLNVLPTCGSIGLSFSYKTPDNVSSLILKEIGDNPKVHLLKEPNYHKGPLGFGNAFIITADFVSLISEACTTGAPVYVIGVDHCKWNIADFHKSLRERGAARQFMGFEDMSKTWRYVALNDTEEAAMRVRDAIYARGWSIQSQQLDYQQEISDVDGYVEGYGDVDVDVDGDIEGDIKGDVGGDVDEMERYIDENMEM